MFETPQCFENLLCSLKIIRMRHSSSKLNWPKYFQKFRNIFSALKNYRRAVVTYVMRTTTSLRRCLLQQFVFSIDLRVKSKTYLVYILHSSLVCFPGLLRHESKLKLWFQSCCSINLIWNLKFSFLNSCPWTFQMHSCYNFDIKSLRIKSFLASFRSKTLFIKRRTGEVPTASETDGRS